MRKNSLALIIAFLTTAIDQLTKKLIDTYIMQYSGVVEFLPFLNIVNIRNKGAAFGILAGMGNVFFISISVIAIVVMVVYLLKITVPGEKLAFSLILGGAVGNLIDRVIHGSVIDFIDFYIGKWHWPAFNVADSALTIGIGIFLITTIKKEMFTKKQSSHASRTI